MVVDQIEDEDPEMVAWAFTPGSEPWAARGIDRRTAERWIAAHPDEDVDALAETAASYQVAGVPVDTAVRWSREFPDGARAAPWIEARTGWDERRWDPSDAAGYDYYGVPPNMADEWRTFHGNEVVEFVADGYTSWWDAHRHYSDHSHYEPELRNRGVITFDASEPGMQMSSHHGCESGHAPPIPPAVNTRRLPDYATDITRTACVHWAALGVALPKNLLRDPSRTFLRHAGRLCRRQPITVRIITRDTDESFEVTGGRRPRLPRPERDRVNALMTQVAVDGGIVLTHPTKPDMSSFGTRSVLGGPRQTWDGTQFRRGWMGGLLSWEPLQRQEVERPEALQITDPLKRLSIQSAVDVHAMPGTTACPAPWAKRLSGHPAINEDSETVRAVRLGRL